jgi:hypothetical protein
MDDSFASPVVRNASQEIAPSAGQSRAEAEIKAAYALALQRPRNEDRATAALLKRCEKPSFAKSALYVLERKNNRTGEVTIIKGLNVDFAGEAMRAWENIRISPRIDADTPDYMIITVVGTDLEKNNHVEEPVYVSKTRWTLKRQAWQVVLETRENSSGQLSYKIAATDDEIRENMKAQMGRARRNCILRLIPGDVQEDCKEKILDVRSDLARKACKDTKQLEKLVERFGNLNVSRGDLTRFLGHDPLVLTPEEYDLLIGVGTSLANGDATWEQVMDGRLKTVTGQQQQRKESATLNMDDIEAGDPAQHTEVTETQKPPVKEVSPARAARKPRQTTTAPVEEPPPPPGPDAGEECAKLWEAFKSQVHWPKASKDCKDAVAERLIGQWGQASPAGMPDDMAADLSTWLDELYLFLRDQDYLPLPRG